MPFQHNSTGVKPSSKWEPIPPGKYLVRIYEAEPGITKKGHNKVAVHVKIIEPAIVGTQKVAGREVKYHTITFLPPDAKGAGMALHFLKCIGEPYQEAENLDVDERRWINKRFYADIELDWIRDNNGNVKLNEYGDKTPKNIIKNIYAGPDTAPEAAAPNAKTQAQNPSDDEVPF